MGVGTEETEGTEQYLQDGPQTKSTEQIKEIRNSISGEGEEYIKSTLDWIEQNLPDKPENWPEVFRKRTADQIMSDKFTVGCTDDALVFIALTRSKGIPTKYVEAVNKDSDGGEGHVFVECHVDGDWVAIDPARRRFQRGISYLDYDITAKGLDSWDCGTSTTDEIKQKTTEYRARK